MSTDQPTDQRKAPVLQLYIPLGIALLLTLATGIMASVMVESNCQIVGNVNCVSYTRENSVACIVMLTAIFVSLFVFRRIIIVTLSALTIPWNVYVIASQFVVIYHAHFFSPFVAAFFSFPAVVAAGIAIMRCFGPASKPFWFYPGMKTRRFLDRWRMGG